MNRIVHVMAPGPMGGAERVVLGGADAQQREGAAVLLLVLHEQRSPEHGAHFLRLARDTDLDTIVIPVRGRMDLQTLQRIDEVLHDFAPSIVHAHGYKAVAYTAWARTRNSLWVATHHGDTGADLKASALEMLGRCFYRAMDGVFAVSEPLAQTLERDVPEHKLHVLPNFVSLAPGASSASRRGKARALFLGRLSREKGVDVLLHALSLGWPEHLERVTIAGDGALRQELEALTEHLGLGARVRFLGFCDDVTGLLREHDLLVMPSRREGMPMALLEALGAGLPVVASDVGSLGDFARAGAPVLLARPNDPEALATCLRQAVSQLDVLTSLARTYSAQVQDRYSVGAWARRSLELYELLHTRTHTIDFYAGRP